ncbi:hypothetical protein NM688_g6116 [Phlebia brevispora]|uniref:Uncharacterized protein n=1 Tax=Phlebia brevispora TaxID=194682 RepID=A0ACC1SJX3_9APHY|nr:hypothetical protein NM688_g6116 [Phlebia brevispora]
MVLPVFLCNHADLKVRSVPDGDVFKVKRECLVEGSEVLRDMFACCDASRTMQDVPEDGWQIMDLQESGPQLNILFNFLHHPPDNFHSSAAMAKPKDFTRIVQNTLPANAIPYPLLRILFGLADKYAFSKDLVDCLKSHLVAYTSTYPLHVYGYATELGLDEIAAQASMYLLHPPLTSYSAEDMRAIPTGEAYHKLVLLHDFRVKKLQGLLEEAEIFPHGYGACPRHSHRLQNLWESRKSVVFSEIQAATDVAAEMSAVSEGTADCQVCNKACTAAVAMLGYKCGKLPRRIDQIPM